MDAKERARLVAMGWYQDDEAGRAELQDGIEQAIRDAERAALERAARFFEDGLDEWTKDQVAAAIRDLAQVPA